MVCHDFILPETGKLCLFLFAQFIVPYQYDYRNKETENSRNRHSSKTLRTSFGKMDVGAPWDCKGEFEQQLLRKNQTSISQDIEEKILTMYAKGML